MHDEPRLGAPALEVIHVHADWEFGRGWLVKAGWRRSGSERFEHEEFPPVETQGQLAALIEAVCWSVLGDAEF